MNKHIQIFLLLILIFFLIKDVNVKAEGVISSLFEETNNESDFSKKEYNYENNILSQKGLINLPNRFLPENNIRGLYDNKHIGFITPGREMHYEGTILSPAEEGNYIFQVNPNTKNWTILTLKIFLTEIPLNTDYDLYLYDNDKKILLGSSTRGGNLNEYIEYKLEKNKFSTNHGFRIKVSSHSGFSIMPYKLSIFTNNYENKPSAIDYYDTNDNFSKSFYLGEVYKNHEETNYGLLGEKGNNDYYKYNKLDRTETNLMIELSMPSGVDYDLFLYHETSLIASSTRRGSADEYINIKVSSPGTYHIRIYSHSGSSKTQYYKLKSVFDYFYYAKQFVSDNYSILEPYINKENELLVYSIPSYFFPVGLEISTKELLIENINYMNYTVNIDNGIIDNEKKLNLKLLGLENIDKFGGIDGFSITWWLKWKLYMSQETIDKIKDFSYFTGTVAGMAELMAVIFPMRLSAKVVVAVFGAICVFAGYTAIGIYNTLNHKSMNSGIIIEAWTIIIYTFAKQ